MTRSFTRSPEFPEVQEFFQLGIRLDEEGRAEEADAMGAEGRRRLADLTLRCERDEESRRRE